MSLTKKRYTYVDFTTHQKVPLMNKTDNSAAVATAADNQVDYMWLNGGADYFEFVQTGQNDKLHFIPQATGWLVPLDATDADGIEMTQGNLAGAATPMKFTAQTDAFFIKVKLIVTDLNETDVVMVGFRELGTYTDITTPATAASVYDEKALIGINSNAGALVSITSIGGSDVTTTATATPVVTGTAITLGVYVSSAGVVTFKVNDAADTLLSAASAVTFTAADVFIPTMVFVSTGAGDGGAVPNIQLVDYECGLQ